MGGRVASEQALVNHAADGVDGPLGFDPSRWLEFRPDSKGEFDEIVARFADGMVHVETLSNQGCYVGFYCDDGRYCQWWIGCTGRGRLTYAHDHGVDDPPRFTAWGVDTRPSEPSPYASAIEARSATDREAGMAEGESAAAKPDAHNLSNIPGGEG